MHEKFHNEKSSREKFAEKYSYQESCAFDFYKFWELLTSYCFSKTWFESENVARIFHKTNRVISASVSLTIRLQSSRFSKIHKFVPLIIFYCEPIFHVIRVSNSHVCQKTVPAIFEKKRLSLSLLWLSKLSLKVENGHAVQHLAPPVLRRAGAPGLSEQPPIFQISSLIKIDRCPLLGTMRSVFELDHDIPIEALFPIETFSWCPAPPYETDEVKKYFLKLLTYDI